ncbi:class I SAM-dependent methyltransferase [Aidingimonas halophila]|uniref:Methyltransferase domain-containing protein n=1 Tax=Aidingimonas halophila TaxID=574349 RepID=A0A1H2UY20_9GAMM|nr:class I SAM-dependent methyltransferase [Aidingimonas halophila]GHC23384.1 transcriptional regulator [Aidingimonas halophila]SDW60990.1 Methyltransferase domain-containing protein [Aidingimonas halophila]
MSEPANAVHAVPDFNNQRADAFTDRMVDILNAGALSLMISIGHRTGLFDTLAVSGPSTSQGIADRAGLNERYVREWLGAMTVGSVIEHDPDNGTYHLPQEYAASLSRASPTDNIAVFAQYIPLLGTVEDDIVHCFQHGGGVPYERFGRFHEIMAEDSGQSVVPALEDHILPLIPGLRERLERGIRVLDAGCGRGKAINKLASLFPNSRFTGYDLAEEAITLARAEARESHNANVNFEVRDLTTFEHSAKPASFELITTFDAVHDQSNPHALLRGIRRALTEDGVYLAQDIKGSGHHHLDQNHPIGPLLYTLSCMHCMTVSLANGGEGLGAMWGREKALAYFREAGFSHIEVHELEHDFQNYWYVCRPSMTVT